MPLLLLLLLLLLARHHHGGCVPQALAVPKNPLGTADYYAHISWGGFTPALAHDIESSVQYTVKYDIYIFRDRTVINVFRVPVDGIFLSLSRLALRGRGDPRCEPDRLGQSSWKQPEETNRIVWWAVRVFALLLHNIKPNSASLFRHSPVHLPLTD